VDQRTEREVQPDKKTLEIIRGIAEKTLSLYRNSIPRKAYEEDIRKILQYVDLGFFLSQNLKPTEQEVTHMKAGSVKDILDGLEKLGYEVSSFELRTVSDGRVQVIVNGEIVGIWDEERKTFVD